MLLPRHGDNREVPSVQHPRALVRIQQMATILL